MDKENKKNSIREEGQGRIRVVSEEANKDHKNQSQRDISEIDRQEGDMEHGELGGNFNQEINNNER